MAKNFAAGRKRFCSTISKLREIIRREWIYGIAQQSLELGSSQYIRSSVRCRCHLLLVDQLVAPLIFAFRPWFGLRGRVGLPVRLELSLQQLHGPLLKRKPVNFGFGLQFGREAIVQGDRDRHDGS